MSNRVLRPVPIWIVSGPSGSGKTTLCAAMMRKAYWKKRLLRSVSYTTRDLRRSEVSGRDYHQVSRAEFLRLKEQGAFLESEEIFDTFYGTPKSVLDFARRQSKDALFCIDVKGAQAVKKAYPRQTTSIFVLPPTRKVLLDRLMRRSTEEKKELEKRLRRVKIECSFMRQYDYIIVNDSLPEAVKRLEAIMLAKKCEGEYVLRSIGKDYR